MTDYTRKPNLHRLKWICRRRRKMEVGRRKLEDGRRKMEVGRRKLEVGSWKSEDGRWKMEVGSWKMEDGSWKTEDGSWKTEVGSWKMEVGRRKIKKAGTSPAFFMRKCSNYEFFSERYLSASMAAIHPEPAAVTACR